MPPGVLWVSSRIADPEGRLTSERFCDWYENTHIQEVTSLPGIPHAARYTAIHPQPSDSTWSSAAPWLTLYTMPDIRYRETDEFRGLDGQSEPVESLRREVFERARFDTRFYESVQVYEVEKRDGKGNEGEDERKGEGDEYGGDEGKEGGNRGKEARYLISAALQPAAGGETDFEKWYREEHLHVLSQCEGYVRSRRYVIRDASTLDRFRRVRLDVPHYLALHEFDGETLPWDGLKASAETEWAKRVMGGLTLEEVGWYELKRVYG
ncbi:hypothetical protein K491DRAFT_695472 [Lophiostoma macrostomum CBS 122681]|uniref:EthD domain-containing protein n=1 Tax=Lophiostoma macrostomum CBS 122681 TaxID=1314788 RepID=A0A6A6SY38_9PLEO|nr:hypothetical protein K491DRAFT_695472 [Lophiostoma macrostomum CBS 122681]